MQVDKIRFPESSAIGIKPISKQGSERLIRAAIDYALAKGLRRVTLVHKGNIQKFLWIEQNLLQKIIRYDVLND